MKLATVKTVSKADISIVSPSSEWRGMVGCVQLVGQSLCLGLVLCYQEFRMYIKSFL